MMYHTMIDLQTESDRPGGELVKGIPNDCGKQVDQFVTSNKIIDIEIFVHVKCETWFIQNKKYQIK